MEIEKDLTVQAIRTQWRIQYKKVEELCKCVIKFEKEKNLQEKERLLKTAVLLSKELLE